MGTVAPSSEGGRKLCICGGFRVVVQGSSGSEIMNVGGELGEGGGLGERVWLGERVGFGERNGWASE